MGPNTMLPLLLMRDDVDNQSLMFMLMMAQNRPTYCDVRPPVQPVQPAVNTVYRTWRVAKDGSKTLIYCSAAREEICKQDQ